MAREMVSDELWGLIEPILPLPKPRRFRYTGRKPIENRAALTGIVFVLRTGIPWEDLPKEMGCGCGMTCWRRLRDWQVAGVWDDIHHVLLNHLREADRLDWSRTAVDSSSVRAVFGGADRAEPYRSRQKRHEAPHPRRRPRDADGQVHQRCQCRRRHATDSPCGRRSPGERKTRPSPSPPCQPVGRQGL